MPEEASPFLSRIPRRYRLTLIASILTAGGRHPPHVHEGAWLSGVYYVAVPDHIGDDDGDNTGGGPGRLARVRRPDHDLPEGSTFRRVSHPPRAGIGLALPLLRLSRDAALRRTGASASA